MLSKAEINHENMLQLLLIQSMTLTVQTSWNITRCANQKEKSRRMLQRRKVGRGHTAVVDQSCKPSSMSSAASSGKLRIVAACASICTPVDASGTVWAAVLGDGVAPAAAVGG